MTWEKAYLSNSFPMGMSVKQECINISETGIVMTGPAGVIGHYGGYNTAYDAVADENRFLVTVILLVSHCCCNNYHRLSDLNNTNLLITVLMFSSPKMKGMARLHFFWRFFGRICFLILSAFRNCPYSLASIFKASIHITLTSASVITSSL